MHNGPAAMLRLQTDAYAIVLTPLTATADSAVCIPYGPLAAGLPTVKTMLISIM